MTAAEDARRDAIRALAYRLNERDAAGDERTDPTIFATEFVMALMGNGWRPHPALRPVPARPDAKPPPDSTVHRYASEVRAEIRRRRESGGGVARSA